jgi:hypothetical protein
LKKDVSGPRFRHVRIHRKPGGGATQFRGDQRSGGGERAVAAFCFCGARWRVGVGVALKRLPVSAPAFR